MFVNLRLNNITNPNNILLGQIFRLAEHSVERLISAVELVVNVFGFVCLFVCLFVFSLLLFNIYIFFVIIIIFEFCLFVERDVASL